MKKLLNISALLLLVILSSVSVRAQKFGHLNSGNILSEMPATTASDKVLKEFQDSLVEIGKQRYDVLEADFEAFKKEYSEGNVPPIQAQKKQAELQKREEDLITYEQQMNEWVAIKRQELLEPILEQLHQAIQEVGKEQGYTMIFDTSIFNAILFSQDSDDVEALVKAKLDLE